MKIVDQDEIFGRSTFVNLKTLRGEKTGTECAIYQSPVLTSIIVLEQKNFIPIPTQTTADVSGIIPLVITWVTHSDSLQFCI